MVPLTEEGYITKEEFFSFYRDLSLNILNDKTFGKFVSSHWNYDLQIKEDLKVEEVKEAIKMIRFKLIQMTDGTHEEFLLKRVFDEFDLNKNGVLSEEELYAMLVKMEIPTQDRLIKPLIRKLDRNQNGRV